MEVESPTENPTNQLPLIVTNGLQKGESRMFDYDENTTFEDLKAFLQAVFGDHDIRLFLDESGRQSLCAHAIAPIRATCLHNAIMPTWSIPLSVTPFGDEIPIRLYDAHNRVKVMRIHDTDCVDVLKVLVEEWLQIAPSEQVLSFPGHSGIVRDSDCLRSLGVRSYTRIDVGVVVRGAGAVPDACYMVDVSQKHAMQDLAFGPRGHSWERLAKGVCISGQCGNAECEAFGRTVYCSKGFGVMDVTDVQAVCPACEREFAALGMGFNNCFYSIRGVKDGGADVFRKHWSRVGNFYRTWDVKSAGVVKWCMLQVVTRSLHRRYRGGRRGRNGTAGTEVDVPVATNCAICFNEMFALQQIELNACGHSFHSDCWAAWDHSQRDCFQVTRCPLCRKVV